MKQLLLVCIFVYAFYVQAETKQTKKQISIVKILNLPIEKRFFYLKKYASFHQVKNIFLNKKQKDSVRWNALMALTRLYPNQAKPYIQKALNHSSWFLKNAGLVAIEMIDTKKAVHHAVLFLEHPSMVLRTAAVEVIRKHKAKKYKSLLWKKLSAKENFRKGQSLWIRRYIVNALASFSNPQDADKFFNLLEDTDPHIRSIALKTVNQLIVSKKPVVAREGFEPPTRGL